MALKEWDMLGPHEKTDYITRAGFLIDRGYVLDTTVEKLAKKIFEAEAPELDQKAAIINLKS